MDRKRSSKDCHRETRKDTDSYAGNISSCLYGKKGRLKNSEGHFLKLGKLEAHKGVLSLDQGGSWRQLTEQLIFSVGGWLTSV